MSDWLISSPLIMGGDQEEGGEQQNNELDLLKMDPNLLTFEQQIRRAELESMREMRQREFNEQNRPQQIQPQQPDVLDIELPGISRERLAEIIKKNPDEMTEEEIMI